MEPTRLEPKPPGQLPVNELSDHQQLRPLLITMKQLLKWALARLKEGSSWAGIGIVAAALGLSPEIAAQGYEVLVAAAGLLAVILKDKSEGESDE